MRITIPINSADLRFEKKIWKAADKLWLKYEYNDIKYITVENSRNSQRIFEFIMEELSGTKE